MEVRKYQISSEEKQCFAAKIKAAKRIAIAGHKNPDGDCVGSCMGLYHYIKEQYPEKEVEVLLEPIAEKFCFIKDTDKIRQEEGGPYDLFCSLDCSDQERLGSFAHLLDEAPHSMCIDHHFTNRGFGEDRYIYPESSSTCEVLFQLMEEDRIPLESAVSLYMGIVHDTGVFKHSNTTRKTMEIAGALIEKGVRPEHIIDDTFYKKTYIQNQILGRALMESIQMLEGRLIFSIITKKDFVFYGIDSSDLDGVIDQLRVTEGTECALLLYEKEDKVYKVSLRANDLVDVSAIAMEFGGGGHVKAAGCTMEGNPRDIVMNIARRVEAQLEDLQKEKNSVNVARVAHLQAEKKVEQ